MCEGCESERRTQPLWVEVVIHNLPTECEAKPVPAPKKKSYDQGLNKRRFAGTVLVV